MIVKSKKLSEFYENLGDSIYNAYWNTVDWVGEPDSPIVRFARRSVIALSVATFYIAPHIYFHVQGNKMRDKAKEKSEKIIKEIEQSQSFIFTSVNDCVSQGFEENKCDESLENAENLVSSTSAYGSDIVAWQVGYDDIVGLSVPLYQTPDSTKGIRQDGKIFNLNP